MLAQYACSRRNEENKIRYDCISSNNTVYRNLYSFKNVFCLFNIVPKFRTIEFHFISAHSITMNNYIFIGIVAS